MPFPATHPALERALAAQGYDEPTPVQAAVLAPEAAGRDLLVSAQTGSGKTVAFGLAMGPTLLGEEPRFTQTGAPLALVIAPTRELALQVNAELAWLYAQTGAGVVSCVGGMDPRREQRGLAAGCHIVVGTPGRLKDHLERGNLDLSELRVAVLDEADEMLDMGFREDLEAILDAAPAARRTLMFSATIAREIAALARRYQTDAHRIDTVARGEAHGDIAYTAIRIAPNEIEHGVVNVLRFFEAPGALVFCNTREGVRHMQAALRERGFSVVGLSGELGQRERSDALQALRDGQARVCVATDVAARGLDLPDLGLVIHADLPVNKQGLLHRSGRTGRAGKKGISVLLVPYTRRRKAEALLASAHIEAEWRGPPSAEEIRAQDQVRLLSDPILAETAAEEDLTLARLVLAERTPEDVAAALIRLYRARLPSPEDLYDDPRDARATRNDRAARGERPERPTAERPAPGQWRPEREEGPFGRPDRLAPEDVTWFRISVGRKNNADPKWLIPLICRRGHITKKEIGSIRVLDNESKFEVANAVVDRFVTAVQAVVGDDIRIETTNGPGSHSPRKPTPSGPRPPFKNKEFTARPADETAAFVKPAYVAKPAAENPKPYAGKPYAPKLEGEGAKSFSNQGFRAKPAGEKVPYARPAYAGRPDSETSKPYAGKPYAPKPQGEGAKAFKDVSGKPNSGGSKPYKGKSPGGKPYAGKAKTGGKPPFKGPPRAKSGS